MVIRINVKIKNLYEMALKTGKHYKHIFCNIIILDNSAGQILNPSGLFFFKHLVCWWQLWVNVYIRHMYMSAASYTLSLPGSLWSGNQPWRSILAFDKACSQWGALWLEMSHTFHGSKPYWLVMLPEMSIPSFNMHYMANISQALFREARVQRQTRWSLV